MARGYLHMPDCSAANECGAYHYTAGSYRFLSDMEVGPPVGITRYLLLHRALGGAVCKGSSLVGLLQDQSTSDHALERLEGSEELHQI